MVKNQGAFLRFSNDSVLLSLPSISFRLALTGSWLLLIGLLLSCQAPRPEQAEVTISTPPVKLSGLLLPGSELLASAESACAPGPAELIYLQGMEVQVRDTLGQEQPLQDCLSGVFLQLLDNDRHALLHRYDLPEESVLLATGGNEQRLRLPDGYGLPLYSNETLVLTARWKNEELYRRPQQLTLSAKLSYSRQALKPLTVTVVGSQWAWQSGPEVRHHRWSWPSPPQAEMVAVWPLVGNDCLSLEMMRGEKLVLSVLDNPGLGGGRLDGGDWSLRASSRQADGFQRQSGASLLVYTAREKP